MTTSSHTHAIPESATERFRTHLRERLTEMRDNASRIGASSIYIESFDRSINAVLVAIAAGNPMDEAKPVSDTLAPTI